MQWCDFWLLKLIARHSVKLDQLIVALSTGAMSLYSLNLDKTTPQLHHIGTYEHFDSSTLLLSLSVEKASADILATLSTGEAAIIDGSNEGTIKKSWKAHDLEVWCSAWKTSNEVLTGGDDSMLKLWDIREDTATPSITSKWYVPAFRIPQTQSQRRRSIYLSDFRDPNTYWIL
jgi:WD40 repeat protein